VVFIEDLVGLGAIAQRVGVTRYAVLKWRDRFPDFPTPVADAGSDGPGSAPLFDWVMIEKFLEDHPRIGVVG